MKKILLTLAGMLNLAWAAFGAASLNDHADEFFKTQTGSYLKAMHPGLSPEEATKAAIRTVLDKYEITGVTADNKDEKTREIFVRIEPYLLKEITMKDQYFVFYHGHSNDLSLYLDTLKTFVSIASLKDLSQNHPLRLKMDSPLKNVDQFLGQFTQEYKKAAQDKGVAPYDPRRNSGFTFAPDLSDFARENLLSVNPSLFGNTNNAFESTFYYFLNSFNVGNPNEKLIKTLLEQTGIAKSDPQQLKQQIEDYKALFNERLRTAGGGLMQIFVKKDQINKLGYASWAKGLPYYVKSKGGSKKIVTRDGSYAKKLPELRDKTKDLVRPDLEKMLTDYAKDAIKFGETYTPDPKHSSDMTDDFQVRLFINPAVFSDPNKVLISHIYRSDAAEGDFAPYLDALKKRMAQDLSDAIANETISKDFTKSSFSFGKLYEFVTSKAKSGLKEVLNIIKKAPKALYDTALDIIKAGIELSKKAADKLVMIKLGILEKLREFTRA